MNRAARVNHDDMQDVMLCDPLTEGQVGLPPARLVQDWTLTLEAARHVSRLLPLLLFDNRIITLASNQTCMHCRLAHLKFSQKAAWAL
jgi:hypothetical protein